MSNNRNRWFLAPLFGKGYPTDMVARFGAAMPQIQPGDLAQIAVQTDFLGVNFYYPVVVRSDPAGTDPLGFVSLTPEEMRALGYSTTEMGWPVSPDAFRDLLIRLHKEYTPKAIYITENGAAFQDSVSKGQVHDPQRVDYLKKHLTAVQSAISAGSPVQGYFLWSLIDNFEWAFSYGKRFGIVYINYNTQARIPKDSAAWYRQVIAANTV